MMVLLKGSLEIELNSGEEVSTKSLLSPGDCVLIPSATWRRFSTQDPNTVVLVLADRVYEPEDYIRDFNEYLEWFHAK